MDDLFDNTMVSAQQTFSTNRTINIVVVVIGVVLLGNSIAFGWYKQSADAFSYFMGGLGLSTFIALFFFQTQTKLEEAVGKLAQIQMIYKAHSLDFETISDFEYKVYQSGNMQMPDLTAIDNLLEGSTDKYASMVKTYVESEVSSVQGSSPTAAPPTKTIPAVTH